MPQTQSISTSQVLTTPQACRLLKITRQTLYAWIQKKRIKPWMMVGGASWLFQRDEVERCKNLRYTRGNGS